MTWLALIPNEYGELIPTPLNDAPPVNWYDELGIIRKESDFIVQGTMAVKGSKKSMPEDSHIEVCNYVRSLLESHEAIIRQHEKAGQLVKISRDEIIDAISTRTSRLDRQRVQGGPEDHKSAGDIILEGKADKMLCVAHRAESEDVKEIRNKYSDLRRLEWARYRLPVHLATIIELQYYPLQSPAMVKNRLGLSQTEYYSLYELAISTLAQSLQEAL